jgi:hypothetical protein
MCPERNRVSHDVIRTEWRRLQPLKFLKAVVTRNPRPSYDRYTANVVSVSHTVTLAIAAPFGCGGICFDVSS